MPLLTWTWDRSKTIARKWDGSARKQASARREENTRGRVSATVMELINFLAGYEGTQGMIPTANVRKLAESYEF